MDPIREGRGKARKYQGEFDWDETLPSTAVVEAVATATQCRQTDLTPLYGTVDPDGLDRLLAGGSHSGRETTVSFTYAGCELVLDSDGAVSATLLG